MYELIRALPYLINSGELEHAVHPALDNLVLEVNQWLHQLPVLPQLLAHTLWDAVPKCSPHVLDHHVFLA